MKYTNTSNLPLPMASALQRDDYVKVGDISVSSLISAPRRVALLQRHDGEIVTDVTENMWLLLGKSIHKVLETADTTNLLPEERLIINVNGWIVSGQPDLWADKTLDDFKVTSVFSFLLGEKPDWERQLNCYARLYTEYGFGVTQLRIIAILRDWSQSRVARETNYPETGIMVVNIPLWRGDLIDKYIRDRVFLHQIARNCADDELPFCTPEERWERPTTWAVMKDGNKKASRVFPLSVEAHHYISTQDKKHLYSVLERPGESVRCERFCKALPWCNQAKEMEITESQEQE